MGDERGDDEAGRRTRADDYSSARIGAAAALTIVLVVLLNAKATAMQERTYANRAGSTGPSATAYIDRDGTNRKIATIAAAVASGVNMNEWVHESIECLGAGKEPYTDAQFESVARLIVAAHKATGLPINRSTVVVHADINSVSRRSDPWPPATREARVKRVIARANAILLAPITTVAGEAGDSLSA